MPYRRCAVRVLCEYCKWFIRQHPCNHVTSLPPGHIPRKHRRGNTQRSEGCPTQNRSSQGRQSLHALKKTCCWYRGKVLRLEAPEESTRPSQKMRCRKQTSRGNVRASLGKDFPKPSKKRLQMLCAAVRLTAKTEAETPLTQAGIPCNETGGDARRKHELLVRDKL